MQILSDSQFQYTSNIFDLIQVLSVVLVLIKSLDSVRVKRGLKQHTIHCMIMLDFIRMGSTKL